MGFKETAKQAILAPALIRVQEENPNFTAEVAAKLPKDKPIVVICDKGGNYMDSDRDQSYSQSLVTAYRLIKMGYEELYVLKGGLREYQKQGLPCWGRDDGEPGPDEGLEEYYPDQDKESDKASRWNSIFDKYYFAAALASASVMLAVIGSGKRSVVFNREQ